ncbi:MAG: DUF4097 family beta strand repeat-containing protein [Pseudomonadota bacterium]
MSQTRNSLSLAKALLCASLASAATVPAVADTTVEREFALADGGHLKIINVQGKIEVRAWSRQEVRLVAELEGDPESLIVKHDEDHAEIRVEADKRWYGRSDSRDADLRIDVPENVRLEISSVSADVSVDGHHGDQRVQSVSGDIDVDSASRDVQLETVSGDIEFDGNGAEGRFYVNAVSGDAEVLEVNGEVRVSTISGDARVRSEVLDEAKLESVSGEITLYGHLRDRARLRAGSVSGEVTLHLCKRENVEFDLESFSGDIVDRVTRQRPKEEGWGPGSRLRFREGDGSVRVAVNTMSGSIDIRDCD